jgi:hypothetical protein
MSAAGGIGLMSGLGLLKYMNNDGSGLIDMIPVDFITNGILVATCKGGSEKGHFEVYNAGTSYSKKITLREYNDMYYQVYKNKKFNLQQYPAVINFVPSKFEFNMRK